MWTKMRYMKGCRCQTERILSLVLLLLLPLSFATTDDVITAGSTECDGIATEAGERGNYIRSCTGSRRTGSNSDNHHRQHLQFHHGQENDDKETLAMRTRRRELHKLRLLFRLFNLRKYPQALANSGSRDSDEILNSNSMATQLPATIFWPQCSGPRDFSGTWNDGTHFRLYFGLDSLEPASPSRETRVVSAFLYLKRKSTPASNGHRAAVTSGRGQHDEGGKGGAGRGHGSSAKSSPNRSRRPARAVSSNVSRRTERGNGSGNHLKVVVYSYNRVGRKNRLDSRSIVQTLTLSRGHSSASAGWLRINVTQIVEDWIKRTTRNVGLQVTVPNGSAASDELNPSEYFEGTNCTPQQSSSSAVQLPFSTLDENSTAVQIVNHIAVQLKVPVTQPFLEVIAVDVSPLSSSTRPQHDVEPSTGHSTLTNHRGSDKDEPTSTRFQDFSRLITQDQGQRVGTTET